MWRTSFLTILAIAFVGTSAVFTGRHEGSMLPGKLLLGANKCTWGPGYWCKNISTTHECGSIEHCVTKVWNSRELPKDESSPCTVCVDLLTKLEKFMKKDITVDVVEAFIHQACSSVLIPAELCQKYLDPYVEELRRALVEHIKPQVMCNAIHFCNNEEGVGKTYQRLELVLSDGTETSKPSVSSQDAALAAVLPLGPAILTGNNAAVYGGAVAPLTCSDGQVYWCKSLENAEECKKVEHCKKVVWANEKLSPLPEISQASPSSTLSPLSFLSLTRVAKNSPQCASGQTFWCASLANAASCNAMDHCMQSVWLHQRVNKDGDSVCQICKDMVRQARDQLESNETQHDLEAVLKGSCSLMPVAIVRDGCDRLVDDFVPELVEVLSSQMNPDVVCSVAGLCNNAAIDKLLASAVPTTTPKHDENADCKNCASFADLLTTKFNSASEKQVMDVLQTICSEFSSLADVCYKILGHTNAYSNLRTYFSTGMVTAYHLPYSILNMCRVNNLCTNQTMSSGVPSLSVEVSHKAESGLVPHKASGDNLPCDLCDQLVLHLKDILIANTTEAEFKQVLQGICHQTGAFAKECLSYVDQYYSKIYGFLTSELNPNVICVDVGLCPKKPTVVFDNIAILSAIPVVPIEIKPVSALPKFPKHIVSNSEESSEEDHKKLPTPLSPHVLIESSTKPACMICEYILHFIQVQVADMKNEKEILSGMKEACNQMPGQFAQECTEFIEEYGTAFIALAIQQIDPSQVCPKLRVCSLTAKAPISFSETSQNKGACPLCLLAVKALDDSVLNNRTEENIKHKLDTICTLLPKHLSGDCDRFVSMYYDELLDMLVAETTPQEICVYIRLCLPPKRTTQPITISPVSAADVSKDSQACILCEFIMTNLDHIIADKKTDEEIKHAVHGVCHVMPKSVRQECDDFVNKYADLIIQLLSQSLNPRDVCTALNVCKPTGDEKVAVTQCAICDEAMSHLDDAMTDSDVKNNNVKEALDKVCYHVTKDEFDDCNKLILKFGTKILTIIDSTPSYLICSAIKVCPVPPTHGVFLEYADSKQNTQEYQHSEPYLFGKLETCTRFLGVTRCESQLVVAFIGLLMCVSLVVIFLVARRVRTRYSRGGVTSTPYEKLYQPTTVPIGTNDFTATIVR